MNKPNIIKTIFSPLRLFHKITLKGEKVRCNICGNTFKNFRNNKTNKCENSMCPYCDSIESTRVLWFYITNEVIGKKNKNNFLYFSPEKAILKKLQALDISLQTSKISYLNNIEKTPHEKKLEGGKYDVIIFHQQLQYITNEKPVFEELKRLLRPGGFVIITTIINWEMDHTYENITTDEDKDRLKSYFEPGVQRIYGSNFHKHLKKTGLFDVEEIDYAFQLGNAAINYYQLGNRSREIIFKCKKI